MEALDSCHLMYDNRMSKQQLSFHIKLLHKSKKYYNLWFNKNEHLNFLKSL